MRIAYTQWAWPKKRLLVLLFALCLILNLGLPSVAGAAEISSNNITELTNQQRISAGLSPLIVNEKLNHSARLKAEDMMNNNYWAHNSPSGVEPWAFIEKADYEYRAAGENLARNFSTDNSVVEGWMNSPTHRENMLKSEYEEIGIAVITGEMDGKTTRLVVAHYGQPTKQESLLDIFSRKRLQNAFSGLTNSFSGPLRTISVAR